jgi:CRP/FNR family transcriptional regulator, cyclic AMP receptor protein
MTFGEILAYAALLLLIASTFMRTIIWLRLLALASNAAIVLYGIITPHYPVLVLGLVLAGLNIWRLMEMRRLVTLTREATAASGAAITIDWLLPFMRPLAMPADSILFRKDSEADAMYFISRGTVRFEELGLEMGKGALFGEIGIFSHDKRRTATAKCTEDCSLMQISAEKVRELYFQNPDFGFFIVGLITRRLMEDAAAGTLKP